MKVLSHEETIELDLRVARRLISTKRSAESRNIEFGLTLKEVKRLVKTKKCYYTGEELSEIPDSPNQHTIDRVDNEKGYIPGNVVACTSRFNKIKGNLTVEQVTLIVKAFKKKKIKI